MGGRADKFALTHPEAFSVGNAQNLVAMRAKVNMTLSQNGSKLTHPDGSQFGRTMRTNRFDIVFNFKINHFVNYVGNNSVCKQESRTFLARLSLFSEYDTEIRWSDQSSIPIRTSLACWRNVRASRSSFCAWANCFLAFALACCSSSVLSLIASGDEFISFSSASS
jgi:hypothetical protein